MITIRLALLSAVVAIAGCASGYQQFYRPAPGASPEAVAAIRVAPPPPTPAVERAPSNVDPNLIVDAYARRGYVLIGSASFNSGQAESDQAAVQQGVRVGADLVVILDPRYTGTVTGVLPMTTPTTTTAYTQGTATAYGPGGTVTARGNSTTTIYGTQTSYVPFAINRSDYGAGYFVKRNWTLGALWRDVTDSERQALQSNKGVAIRVVVEGSPAFRADILPGDIITAVNGEPVYGQEDIGRILRGHAGQTVTMTIFRRGAQLDARVALN